MADLTLPRRGRMGGEEQPQLESQEPGLSSMAPNRQGEAAAQIHSVLPNPSPLIQLSAGQTSQIFLCVREHVKSRMC